MPLRLDKEICKTLSEDFANLPNNLSKNDVLRVTEAIIDLHAIYYTP